MAERYFTSQPIVGDRAALDGPETHHLLHVMRAAVGDQVILFDNSGAEFRAVIEKLGRASAELHVIERLEIDRELPFALSVGVALPKGDRQKWLVEKLTELGVATLVPLATERCVAQPAAGALDRLRRSVIEASKQCGRNKLMQIAEPLSLTEWLEFSDNNTPVDCQEQRLFAHPGAAPLPLTVATSVAAVWIAIGPEGGFTEAEVNTATAAGWQPVGLGSRILRVETAAIALAAALSLQASGHE